MIEKIQKNLPLPSDEVIEQEFEERLKNMIT